MGQCKDCKSWKAQNEWGFVGLCHKWAVTKYDANCPEQILAPPDSCGYPMGELIRTLADFGCVRFEEREQGPFESIVYSPAPAKENERHILFKPAGKSYSLGTVRGVTAFSAHDLADWLNERWAERERECCDA